MKATGIVRRIDDLGRIVIPKEIRRTLRIRESDPLEIFTDREGAVSYTHLDVYKRQVCMAIVLWEMPSIRLMIPFLLRAWWMKILYTYVI